MPDWLINAVATGGPAVSLIMTYMWWNEKKRAERYEAKLMEVLEANNQQGEAVRDALLVLKAKGKS